ncbi:MAG: GMC family oxidoreductase [Nitrospirae bacterium]|nr:GMC family oxidoreductase [Nitrospirota bacterium]
MIIEARDLKGDFVQSADAVVVGTGAGGAPAAAVLAEAGMKVVVLEKGGYYLSNEFNGDQTDMTRRLWVNAGFNSTKHGVVTLLQGSCVGGSTLINMCLSWKTPPETFERWKEETGVEGWTPETLAPYLDEVWRAIHAETATRPYINRNNRVFEMGAQSLGWDVVPMARNVSNCQNLGLCLYGCPVNAKQSTLLTYIPKADAAGATILAGADTQRVLTENGQAAGVEGILRDRDTRKPIGSFKVKAPIVCLAAGVIETPGILLRSRLEGRHDTAGKFLTMHTHTFCYGIMDEPVHLYYGAPQTIAIMEFADVLGRRGPGFIIEALGVHTVNFAMLGYGIGEMHAEQMKKLDHLAMADAILRDRTRGYVELTDAGLSMAVYEYTAGDLALIRESVKRTAECLLAAGAQNVVLPGSRLGPISSRDLLDEAAEAVSLHPEHQALATAHLFSTARMAGSPELGYCNSMGEAWATKGLYITDASALPANVGVNPQVTIMAAALRIAQGIVEQRKRG